MGLPRPPPAFAIKTSTRPHSWTTRATIAPTASWSRTSTSIPKAVPPEAAISATVPSAVISLASASNSYTTAGSGQQNHPFRCRCGGNAILGNKVLSVAGFGCRGGEAGTGRGRGTIGKGGDGSFPSQGRTSFAMLPVTRCFWVNWGCDWKLLAVIDEHDAV